MIEHYFAFLFANNKFLKANSVQRIRFASRRLDKSLSFGKPNKLVPKGIPLRMGRDDLDGNAIGGRICTVLGEFSRGCRPN